MKRLFVVALAMLLLAGVVYAKDTVVTKKAGGYTVDVSFEKAPPVTGVNELLVTMKDASGKEVTGARVKVEYFMNEKMSATRKSVEMLYMGSSAAAAPSGADYKASLDFSMPGQWHVVVKVTAKGKTSKADFFIKVQ